MSERFSLSQEEEAQFRQGLLRKARKGDAKAKQELQNIYNVRIWSEQERAKLVYNASQPKSKGGKVKTRKT